MWLLFQSHFKWSKCEFPNANKLQVNICIIYLGLETVGAFSFWLFCQINTGDLTLLPEQRNSFITTRSGIQVLFDKLLGSSYYLASNLRIMYVLRILSDAGNSLNWSTKMMHWTTCKIALNLSHLHSSVTVTICRITWVPLMMY